MIRTTAIAYTAIVAFTAAACAVDGEPIPLAKGPESTEIPFETIRQHDDSGKKLPFTTNFPDRWSNNNNGTKYEPCTALTDTELRDAGLDPNSVSDIALANNQTVRGCQWDHADIKGSGMSQGTGDTPTFEEDMADRSWHKVSWDIRVHGRLVMVDSDDRYNCSTTVKSGHAPVTTIVVRTFNPPPIADLCEFAIDFTRRTIPRMEPPAP